MFIGKEKMVSKTYPKIFIEVIVGLINLIIVLPFMFLFAIGHFSERLINKLGELEDRFVLWMNGRS